MSTFIELKQSSIMDPFQDPKGSPEKDLPAGLLFEHEDFSSQRGERKSARALPPSLVRSSALKRFRCP